VTITMYMMCDTRVEMIRGKSDSEIGLARETFCIVIVNESRYRIESTKFCNHLPAREATVF
jgi:hypothetical protein